MATKSFNQTLTQNGGSDGTLTVANSSGFEIGEIVFLAAKNERIRQLKVASKPSATTVLVTDMADSTFDASAFTTAKEAKLFQPRSALLVPSNPGNAPLTSSLITDTTTISAPSGKTELVLNADTGNALVIKKSGVEKSVINADGKLGVGVLSPTAHVEAAGIIHSTTGGFKFPDGTIQTTAGGGGGGGGGGDGWTTVREIDFTALANQTISTDGNYTLGGVVWGYSGQDYTREATAIVNGTGLVLKPSNQSVWWPPNNEPEGRSPRLTITLPDLIPNFHSSSALRVSLYFTFSGVTQWYQQLQWGVEVRPISNTRLTYHHLMFAGWDNGSLGPAINSSFFENGSVWIYEGANQKNKLPYANENVTTMTFPHGLIHGPCLKTVGTWNSGWPTNSSMYTLSYDETNNSRAMGYVPLNKMYLHIGATHQVSFAANSEFVIKALKIEMKDV